MNNIKLDNPNLLLYIGIPLVVLIIIGYFAFIHKKSQFNIHNISSVLLHLVMAALITLAAAGFHTSNKIDKTAIYVLADVSYSTNEKYDEMDEYIKKLYSSSNANNQVGVIAFAREAKLVSPLGTSYKGTLKNADCDASSTNLANALEYAYSLFKDDEFKRIIVLSDGAETDGDALTVAKTLTQNEVRIDTCYVNDTVSLPEIQITNVEYTKDTYVGKVEAAHVTFNSSKKCTATLKTYKNDALIQEGILTLSGGIQFADIKLDTSEGGNFNYKFEVEATSENDTLKENNVFLFSQNVVSEIKALIIGSSNADISTIKGTLSKDYVVDSYVTTSTSVPYRIDDLLKYDQIILSNVDLYKLNKQELFVSALETFVKDYGKSLLTFGGENTYFKGGFAEGVASDMLPLTFDGNGDSVALAIVLDVSGTMAETALELAKKGCIECLKLLDEKDYVTLITFSTYTKIVVPVTRTTEKNKEKIIEYIEGIESGDGTKMSQALEKTYSQLNGITDVKNKQCILITDGMPFDSGESLSQITTNANAGIYTSAININNPSGTSFLKNCAENGKGKYHYVSSTKELPDVMLAEVTDNSSEPVITETITPKILTPNNATLKGIEGDIPEINGYNYAEAKYNSTSVLGTTYVDEDDRTYNVSLYAYWNYGKGKVSSCGTNLTSWASTWTTANNGRALLNNIYKNSLPESRQTALTFDIESNGVTTTVNVTIPKISFRDVIKATVTSPSGIEETKTLILKEEVFSESFTSDEIGIYTVRIINENDRNPYDETRSFCYSYSQEFDLFVDHSPKLLYSLSSDEKALSMSDDVNSLIQTQYFEEEIYDYYYVIPFLIAAASLLLVDIIIRKFTWKDIKALFKPKKKVQ